MKIVTQSTLGIISKINFTRTTKVEKQTKENLHKIHLFTEFLVDCVVNAKFL
jgi:hypothetical protein